MAVQKKDRKKGSSRQGRERGTDKSKGIFPYENANGQRGETGGGV